MSISQISHFLIGIPPDAPKPQYYFMYEDHFSHEAFRKHYLNTKKVSFGFLKDWTWHINTNHEPNIRFTFNEHMQKPEGPVIAPASEFSPSPADNDGTFGFVFTLTPEVQAMIDEAYNYNKVAMVQDVNMWLVRNDGTFTQIIVKALVYWDPLYTADGCRKNLLSDTVQREKWKRGLVGLMRIGVPHMWVNAVQRRLAGERVDPEPLFSDFQRQPRPLISDSVRMAKRNFQDMEGTMGPHPKRQAFVQNGSATQSQDRGRSMPPTAFGISAVCIRSSSSPMPQSDPTILNHHECNPQTSNIPLTRPHSSVQFPHSRYPPNLYVHLGSAIPNEYLEPPLSPIHQPRPTIQNPQIRPPPSPSPQHELAIQHPIQQAIQSQNTELGSIIQDQLVQNVPLEAIVREHQHHPLLRAMPMYQRRAQLEGYVHFLRLYEELPPAEGPLRNAGAGLKRRPDADVDENREREDRSMEELKRRKREMMMGGKLKEGRTGEMS